MHAPQRSSLRVVRNAALHKPGIQSRLFKFVPAPGPREKSTLIGFTIQTNFDYSADLGFLKEHM